MALGGEFVNNRLAFGCLTRRHRLRCLCPLATMGSHRARANGGTLAAGASGAGLAVPEWRRELRARGGAGGGGG